MNKIDSFDKMKGENKVSNLSKLKEVDMLPLSNDYVFKRIFGKGGNENTIIDIELQVGNTTAIERRLVVYNAKLMAGEIKVSEKYQKAKDTIVICIINDNVIKRNAYFSLAVLKYEETEEIRYVNMGYEKEVD